MYSPTNRGGDEDLRAFLRQLQVKGVILWIEGTTLRFRARKGVLTEGERQALLQSNGAIAALLERDSCSSLGREAADRSGKIRRAPLSFIQLAHWNRRNEADGRPIRQVASATRLRGSLRVELLREAISEVVRRHDALRTRIVVIDGALPLQEVGVPSHPVLEQIRITSEAACWHEVAIEREIQRAILEPSDYTTDPLFKPLLLSLDEAEHVLILALDHIISDGLSLHLILQETLTAYAQMRHGNPIELPRVQLQFPDYAAKQSAQGVQSFQERESNSRYLNRIRFPEDVALRCGEGRMGWGMVRALIDHSVRKELRAWAQRYGTTMVMAVFTAYAALVLRWCSVDDAIFQFEIDGRLTPELAHTIGYLAFPLYLRVTLQPNDSFVDLLNTVTAAYCSALDGADFGYAHAQVRRPQFTFNSLFNWLPMSDSMPADVPTKPESDLACSALEFKHPLFELLRADHEPSVVFSERSRMIVGEVSFPRNRFSDQTMCRFACNLENFVSEMVRVPGAHIGSLGIA